MTALDSVIQVVFEVPREIREGLDSKAMIRRGGVIQWATGEAKGQVVSWLREVGGLDVGGRAPTALAAAQFQDLRMAVGAVAGGQALTLGFSILSFVVLNRKLNELGARLDGIVSELVRLKEEVAWLDRRQDVALAARLHAALDQGKWASESGRRDALVGVRADLVEVERHYAGLMEAMLDSRRAHAHAPLFATYQGHLALAGVARLRCEVFLDGVAAALPSLGSTEERLSRLDDAFRAPMKDVMAHPELIRLSGAQKQALRVASQEMRETAHRVSGHGTELCFCAERSLSFSDWQRLGDGEVEPRLALLLPNRDR